MNANVIPKLPGGTWLGHLPAFRGNPIGWLTQAAAHGDMVRTRLGVFDLIMISAPALVQEVLVDKVEHFEKSYGLTLFARPLLGDGLLTANNTPHRRQRKLLAPAFVHKRIAGYAQVTAEHAERGLARLLARGTVEISEQTMQTTLGIVAKTLFDADVQGDSDEVGDALTEAMESIIGSMTATVPLPPPLPTRVNRRIARSTARLDRIIYRLIDERNGEDRGDMLSLLRSARDEDGQPMTRLQIRDEAMTAFLAGHETTANALAWTLYLLAKNPDALAEVEAELDTVLAGRPPVFEDLPRLPATLRALKEAMRLYPPAFMLTRRVTSEVNIGGHALPRNQLVLINIHGIHRRADAFPEPLAFRPARFLDEKSFPRHAYMPFGAGPRMCIGNHFAWMEGQLVLASWLSRARFTLPDPSFVPELEPLITLRPKAPLTMRVQARQVRAQMA
ncbi:MAG: cytochrome P450 [Polyangiales bacterium]